MKKQFFIYYLPPVFDGFIGYGSTKTSWYVKINKKEKTVEFVTPEGKFIGLQGVDRAYTIFEKRLGSTEIVLLEQVQRNCELAKRYMLDIHKK